MSDIDLFVDDYRGIATIRAPPVPQLSNGMCRGQVSRRAFRESEREVEVRNLTLAGRLFVKTLTDSPTVLGLW
jgi:hypothetical protein